MPVTIASTPTLGVPQRPLRRSATTFVVAGICGGLATRLGVKARTVRVLFSLLALFLGLGVLLYAFVWLFLTRSGESESIGKRLFGKKKEFEVFLLSLTLVVVLAVGLRSLRLHFVGPYAWSLILSAVISLVIWRGASSDERTQLNALIGETPYIGAASARGWRSVWLRVLPGVLFVVVGFAIMGHIRGVWRSAIPELIGAAALLFGVLILFAPWWLQTVRELTSERRDRVRAEERAAMVAHIHDSVLQTLTLIERVAGNESDVRRLARAQERELRQWLFDPEGAAAADTHPTFAALVAGIENDIENDYGVRVELVVVGDCEPDDKIIALVAAGREAAINAAKWSGAPSISIYAEVEPSAVSLFVRDTGRGFDPDAVASDRQGIALSIRQRVALIGGDATIRSAVGAGTDVQLVLARQSA